MKENDIKNKEKIMSELTQKQKTILELFELSMKVNSTTKGCIFVRDNAHVNSIDFELCKSKTQYNDKISSLSFYYDGNENFDDYYIEAIEEFKQAVYDYLANLEPKTYYKAEFDLGLTKVSKVFTSQAERIRWIKNSLKSVSNKISGVEPILTEYIE